jgi:hypothetical protein
VAIVDVLDRSVFMLPPVPKREILFGVELRATKQTCTSVRVIVPKLESGDTSGEVQVTIAAATSRVGNRQAPTPPSRSM